MARLFPKMPKMVRKSRDGMGENPWWLRNVRLYQSRMVEFAALRSKVLLDYLAERGARA